MEESFVLLRRELQQRSPIVQIFAHIDSLLSQLTPESFQLNLLRHLNSYRVDSGLLSKVSSFLMSRFDRIYGGQKYALVDGFVEYFTSMDSCDSDGNCNRFYAISDTPAAIHIKTSLAMISDGTTGYSLWEASVALLAILASNHANHYADIYDCFRNKRVLELGSGTGLGGLAIAALIHPNQVLLTDTPQVTNSYTIPNLLLNPHITTVSCTVLNWQDPDLNLSKDFDTIVGCDLVYDPEICPILISLLKSLLLPTDSSITSVLLFCTRRNPETLDEFITDLKSIPGFDLTISSIDPATLNGEVLLSSVDSFRIIQLNRIK